ncbi:disease resistance protein RPS2-like [Fagus crenata]
MEPKKKFWRKNGGGCSFLKLWTKSKLTKQLVVATCPEYTSMQRHTLRILRCMPDVTTIGVHGIGGIGKTSVLKAVVDFPPINSCLMWLFGANEDRELRIIELVDLWIKEGLVAGNNLTDSRKKGCDIVDILVDACLLQRLEGGLSIKMHDLIRDFVSIWLDRQVD